MEICVFIRRQVVKYKLILRRRFSKKKNKIINLTPYIPLSPTDNAEDCEVYLDALSWALANKTQIKNIAISGPYGSGKSSILQTFIRKEEQTPFYKQKWFKRKNSFLNISLATFEPPKDENDTVVDDTVSIVRNDVQRLIELSLLQQLFFREKYSKTPDSRLRKIKRQNSWKLFVQSVGIMLFLFSIMFLFYSDNLNEIIKIEYLDFTSPNIKNIASGLFLIGIFCTIYKLSRSIIGLSIKKLNVQGAEIEIDKNISKSILNNHIDEIIYFFEATNYNVVIIEDLDRFGESEVFTKLREINLLINNSKKITRDIVFIYAIKDDMFQDKDRAKFFDYMIPVIPIVNFSNSGDKLKKMLAESSIKIDDDLVEDLSLFIDDMRLLYNIMNEFYIYSKKVSSQLDMNKLLAIIVYKNLFPKDFTELGENKGELFNTIRSKSSYIQEAISEIDAQIRDLKERIEISEENRKLNIIELRILYNCKIAEKIGSKFSAFKVNDTSYTISAFTSNELFNIIKSGKVEYFYENYSYSNGSRDVFNFNFHELEKQVHPTLTYDQRELMLLSNINLLKKEIEHLNTEKDKIRRSKIKDLLLGKKITEPSIQDKKKELIDILLRNGYINENYLDYISVFHEGALSKSDYQFLINVKRELPPQFDYVLNKKEELLKRLDSFMFDKEYVLNFDLVDTLLVSDMEDEKNNLFKQLANEKEESIRFINEYINKGICIEPFISKIASNWYNMWRFLLSSSNYTEERKEEYFLLLMRYSNVDDLKKLFDINDAYIACYKEFFTIRMENDSRRQLISNLRIKFKAINPDSPKEDLQFLLEKGYYEVNCDMLKTIIPEEKFDSEAFSTKNYTFIKSSGLSSMVQYIENEINIYVNEILLRLDENTNEDLVEYTLLLNNPNLDLDLKVQLIQKIETVINNINEIEDIKVALLLFKYSKVKPTWENIQSMFESNNNTLSEEMIEFLNCDNNAIEFSTVRMDSEPNDDSVKSYVSVCKAIIHAKNIKDETYQLLLRSIPWRYSDFESDKITSERMKVLIANNNVDPIIKNYDYLRNNYRGLNVLLLEKYEDSFIDKLNEISMDKYDLELLLESRQIDIPTKFMYVNTVDIDLIINSTLNASFVLYHAIAKTDLYNINDTLKLKLINKKELPMNHRIELFSKIYLNLTNDQVGSFLISLGHPYSNIAGKRGYPEVSRTPMNEMLMGILLEINYIKNYSPKNNRVY